MTFFVAVVWPRSRWIYLPAGIAMHLAIFLAMGAPFFQFMALYCVFIPWEGAVGKVLRGGEHRQMARVT